MRVRFLKDYVEFRAGEIVNLGTEEAVDMIARGFAEPVRTKTERAVVR